MFWVFECAGELFCILYDLVLNCLYVDAFLWVIVYLFVLGDSLSCCFHGISCWALLGFCGIVRVRF